MMAVTDGTPDAPDLPTPKKRNTTHWKAEAQAAQESVRVLAGQVHALAAERDIARAKCETWETTNAFNYRLFTVAAGVALAGWLTVGWLAFWHYKP